MPMIPTAAQRLRRTLVLLIGCLAASATAWAGTRQYTVTAPDGVAIAVQESGDPQGRAVVFVHGLLGSHLSWDAQVRSPALQGLRLITFDLRGHGQSGRPDRAEAYTDGRRWAEDLAAVIAASKARDPVLVGWSLGAAVITNYLAAHGDKGIAGALYVGGVIELNPEQIVQRPGLYRALASPDLRTHLDAERRFVALCFATPPGALTFDRLIANAALASPTMQHAVHTMSVAAAQGLGAMRKPLLLLYGARDALVRPQPSLQRARTLQPRAQSSVYARSGHAPFVEEASRFNRELLAFVEAAAR